MRAEGLRGASRAKKRCDWRKISLILAGGTGWLTMVRKPMSRQASCTSLATRSIAASFVPLSGAKSITGSSLALAQRPSLGAARGGATGGVWTSACMVLSLPSARERVDQFLAGGGGVLGVPGDAARQHLAIVCRVAGIDCVPFRAQEWRPPD